MNFRVRYSSIKMMLELCKKLKMGTVLKEEIEDLMNHEDYIFEFERYKNRVSKEEFINYFLNLPNIKFEDIENEDLRIHHKYYSDLMDNLDFYLEKASELDKFRDDLFEEKIAFALRGLPEDADLNGLNFIFTIGIGQSFGYVHKKGMHFDFLQLMKDKSIEEFFATISHEVHHVGTNVIYDKLDLSTMPLEELFYLYFSGEGLAVKYCNNAEGVLSRSIYSGPKNVGLDAFTWEYLNNDFDNTMSQFRKTITDIRNNVYKTSEELEKHMFEYWMNPYTEEQDKNDIPLLKHFRLYSFGNDIWGIIHDCFGKDAVFETLNNPNNFPKVFNEALVRIGREDLKI